MKSNKPREFWIRKDKPGCTVYLDPVDNYKGEVIHVIEHSAFRKAVDLLKKFANEDFRGNRPSHSVESYNLLKELGE